MIMMMMMITMTMTTARENSETRSTPMTSKRVVVIKFCDSHSTTYISTHCLENLGRIIGIIVIIIIIIIIIIKFYEVLTSQQRRKYS